MGTVHIAALFEHYLVSWKQAGLVDAWPQHNDQGGRKALLLDEQRLKLRMLSTVARRSDPEMSHGL